MQRTTRIFLSFLAVILIGTETIHGQSKQSIATGEFLSVLAKNVATVLSPTLVGELQDGRPNRTATNATISTTSNPSKSETSTESSRYFGLEADTVRSAQTQSEVRPGSNGFPFNFDENNYRYNYPGINPGLNSGINPGINPGGINPGINSGSLQAGLNPGINQQGFPLRQDFGFTNPGYYNPDFYRDNYRGYPGQEGNFRGPEGNFRGPEGSFRGPDGNLQRGENVNGVAPVETASDAQTGRSPDSLDVTGPNLERYRNFERLQLNPQQLNNFGNSPFLSRQEGRFGQTGYADGLNPNFSNNPNFQNSIGNGYPRNLFQPLGNSYDRQQRFRSNNFDFLPSQRFQNPFDNYPRSLQRGPNFPAPFPFLGFSRENENLVSPKSDGRRGEETSSSETRPKSEILKSGNITNSTAKHASDKKPEILSVQGRIRFGRILLPTLEDYDDVRFRPDDFREYLLTPENKTVNKTNNATVNDV